MAISSDVEAEIYVRDGVIYLTRDIANQVYTETGLTAVGALKGRNNLEADKQYLADNGHWYKNIGGNRTWNSSTGTPDEQLIPITWKYLYESLNNKENQLIQNLNGILGQNNGNFPVEQAIVGNVYYFPRNQKFYYCLKSQTSRVSVPNADFEELSIYQNRKKLENLFNVKTYSYHNTEDVNSDMYIHYTVLKIMNICILEIKFARVANKDIVMPATPLPAEFRPRSTEYLSAVASTGGIKMDYHWLRLEPNGNFYTHNNAGITVRNLQTTIAYIAAN